MPCAVDHIIWENGSDQVLVVGEDGMIRYVAVDSSGAMFVEDEIDTESSGNC